MGTILASFHISGIELELRDSLNILQRYSVPAYSHVLLCASACVCSHVLLYVCGCECSHVLLCVCVCVCSHVFLHVCVSLTLSKDQSACLIRSVCSHVLLCVCVFVVVDSVTHIAGGVSKEGDEARLANRCLPLKQHREPAAQPIISTANHKHSQS